MSDDIRKEDPIVSPHKQKSPERELTKLDKDNIDNQEFAVTLPSNLISKINDALDVIVDLGDKFNVSTVSDDIKLALSMNVGSIDKTLPNDTFKEAMSEGEWVNEVAYDNKKLQTRLLPTTSTGVVTGVNAVNMLTSSMGIGTPAQTICWASMLWVATRPPTNTALVNLDMALSDTEIRLGRDTNGMVFSNYGVVIARILWEFIVEHIESTTIDVSKDKLSEYIKVSDFPVILTGIVKNIYPEGFKFMRSCKNTAILDDAGIPECTYIATGMIDPELMVWVEQGMLTNDIMLHLSKRAPNSTTPTEVLHHQSLLRANTTTVKTITASNGREYVIKITTPMLSDYISSGERWVNKIIDNATELFVVGDDTAAKASKVTKMITSMVGGIYNSYISSISFNGATITDRDSIDLALEAVTSDTKFVDDINEEVSKHIEKHVVALVATPNFTCPECLAKGKDVEQADHSIPEFKEFIPINATELFFDLSGEKIKV